MRIKTQVECYQLGVVVKIWVTFPIPEQLSGLRIVQLLSCTGLQDLWGRKVLHPPALAA